MRLFRMTIINGIEIDFIKIRIDEIKQAIQNNYPIEEKLHVVAVISNPCQFARRYILAREFALRMEQEMNIILYFVELAYGNQQFYVTDKNNKRHLQLRGKTPLWHKENMINIGINKLLPKTWRAVAWIDADIEFENSSWALDTLKVLNGSRDVVQLFSHAIDMDKHENAMSIFPSFGFQYTKGRPYGGNSINMWHPGYAWACTRRAYEKMGGLYELSILGAGDHNMSFAYIGKGERSVNGQTTQEYKDSVAQFEQNAKTLRLGYIPGVIRHYYHGLKKDRKYMERWAILVDNAYKPNLHITKNADGLLIPTAECPQKILDDILLYFQERNEDEGYAAAA
jgi:hypothetical protein